MKTIDFIKKQATKNGGAVTITAGTIRAEMPDSESSSDFLDAVLGEFPDIAYSVPADNVFGFNLVVNDTKREDAEVAMFGCTLADFKESSIMTNWNSGASVLMVAMSLQSDAQEMIAQGRAEEARKTLNLSKALTAEVQAALRENETVKG